LYGSRAYKSSLILGSFHAFLFHSSRTHRDYYPRCYSVLRFLVTHLVLTEDTAQGGERTREYAVDAWVNEEWRLIVSGIAIGDKKIDVIWPVEITWLR